MALHDGMKKWLGIQVKALGQAGYRWVFPAVTLYIDPYLSNYVEEVEGPRSARLVPIAISPDRVTDADYVLITHEHIDHCDPNTVAPISSASPSCKFIAPGNVAKQIEEFGVNKHRIVVACEHWMQLEGGVEVRAVPAAHPTVERDRNGELRYVGYLLRYNDALIYHSGDTSVHDEIIQTIKAEGKVAVAFLPINERNYYRCKQGIIGNMSIRDALQFADDIGVHALIPMHWDMFELNRVYPEEAELVFAKSNYKFQLLFQPEMI
jgi:L-ascorbate 6-phosphate lactonase